MGTSTGACGGRACRAENKDFRLIGHSCASTMVYCSFMPGQIMGKKQLNLFGICPMAACYFPVWAWVPTGHGLGLMRRPGHLRGCGRLGMSTDWGCLRGRGRLGMSTGARGYGKYQYVGGYGPNVKAWTPPGIGKKKGPGEARRAMVPLGACGLEI